MSKIKNNAESTGKLFKGRPIVYIILILLAVLSILPFWIMLVNATRSTPEIQQRALSLLPSKSLLDNFQILTRGSFDALVGFKNSMILASSVTVLAIYFSSLTAYGLVAYDWKFKNAFFTFIMCILMIPGAVGVIGFYQMVWQLGWNNNFLPLILPAMASPSLVFFMRQYLLATLSLEMIEAARIDGSGEFATFNRIVLPVMKPAIATQAIFVFVGSWNNLFLPLILLTKKELFTMPIMVSVLNGDIYNVELGVIYLGVAMTVLPLFVVYFALSKYIIAGVALGGVKE